MSKSKKVEGHIEVHIEMPTVDPSKNLPKILIEKVGPPVWTTSGLGNSTQDAQGQVDFHTVDEVERWKASLEDQYPEIDIAFYFQCGSVLYVLSRDKKRWIDAYDEGYPDILVTDTGF